MQICIPCIFALFKLRSNSMGSDSSHPEQSFQRQNWDLVTSEQDFAVWRNKRDPTENIVERSIYSSSDAEEQEEKQMFKLRLSHPTIVATRYLVNKSSRQFCSTSHKQTLFIEKIPVRLSDIENIPFPDFLHIYYQSLKGFQILARHVGFFSVEEQYIGVNEKGVVKVWMNQDYFKNYFNGGKVSEQFMIKNIIEIIEKNLDHNHIPKDIPSVRNYLYRNVDRLSFEEAIRELSDYINRYNKGSVPVRLDCIDHVGGIQAIANRQIQLQNHKSLDSVESQTPYKAINYAENGTSMINYRSQLVYSQLMKSQCMVAPRIETSPIYYQVPRERLKPVSSSLFLPNIQKNILSPSTVKENTPIVRKLPPASSIHTSNFNISQPPTLIQTHASPKKGLNVQIQQPIIYKLNERPESKSFGAKTSPILFQPQPELVSPRAAYNHRPSPSQVNPLAGKTSLIQLVQPETPQYNQPSINRTFNSSTVQKAFIKQSVPALPSFQKAFPRPIAQGLTSLPNPLYSQRASSKSITERSQQQIPPPFTPNPPFKFNQPFYQSKLNPIQEKANYSRLSTQKATNQVQQLSFAGKIEQNNQRNLSSNFRNELYAYKSDFQTIYTPTNNVKLSQYTTVDIDDGKSSSDFLKKLKQLSNFDLPLKNQLKQQSPTYQNGFSTQQNYAFPLRNRDSFEKSALTKDANSLQNLKRSEQVILSEQFGRNAVSNIISNQSGIHITSQKITNDTPLKFERNLDMKYSMFKADEPPSPAYEPTYEPTYQPSYVFKSYEANFDAEILADMKKLKA